MAEQDPTAEIWKAIPGFDGYEASSLGRLRSLTRMVPGKGGGEQVKRGRILRQRIVRNYLQATVSIGGKPFGAKAHRLVLAAFDRPARAGEACNHRDCDKLNNRPDNLEWVTPKQNTAHAFSNGLMRVPHGERHHNSKLTEDAVREIRALAAAGERVCTIARKFGITHTIVSPIVRRERWRHVE